MTRKLAAFVTAATISMAATAPAVHAMGPEYDMLTVAVINAFESHGLPTDNIDTLTLSQIGQIYGIENDSDTPESNKKQQILGVLRSN